MLQKTIYHGNSKHREVSIPLPPSPSVFVKSSMAALQLIQWSICLGLLGHTTAGSSGATVIAQVRARGPALSSQANTKSSAGCGIWNIKQQLGKSWVRVSPLRASPALKVMDLCNMSDIYCSLSGESSDDLGHLFGESVTAWENLRNCRNSITVLQVCNRVLF